MLILDDIVNVKNVGKERAKKLNKLGINTIQDLIEYFPRNYEDRSQITKIIDIKVNEVNIIKARLCDKIEVVKLKNITVIRTKIKDETGVLDVVWFNQDYLRNALMYRTEYVFTGKIISKNGRIQMESPDFENTNKKELLSTGRIVPNYLLTRGLSPKIFRSIIKELLDNKELENQILEFLPKNIINDNKLCNRKFAIKNIHFPKDEESFLLARKRLVFEELFIAQLKLLGLKNSIENRPCNIKLRDFDTSEVRKLLRFKLTNSQEKVIKDILKDLQNNKNINRLVQGDVGSGKTVIAIICIYLAVKNGYQAALMAPTDILATQHYKNIKEIFSKIGIEVELLSGKRTKREKNIINHFLKVGRIKVLVGTHAIIQDNVEFKNLGLVITDEQHRFGVRQRNLLSEKSLYPHTIVMTATPIPRTLGLILYGDLDISIIDELPPGRQEIQTISVNSSYYDRIYKFLKKNCDEKKQAYIVCPTIEESEDESLKDVLSYTEKLKNDIFKDYKIECIHGKVKNDIKQSIMERFYNGEIDILVSTTVIEVGIDVPNATIILIENAERFGLSQLHQLRGRVGRGKEKSYCILISDSKSKLSKERLDTMVKYSDGFNLSEKDLELRGPGDFFGTKQHGLPEMKIANLYKDLDILELAQESAKKLYKEDPYFESEENIKLKMKLNSNLVETKNTYTL